VSNVRHGGAEPGTRRLTVRVMVQPPAGPSNRYTPDPRSGGVALAGVEPELPASPFEPRHIEGTPVRWETLPMVSELAVRAGLAVASCAMIFGPDKRFLSKRVV
jgi:hypothetical protein